MGVFVFQKGVTAMSPSHRSTGPQISVQMMDGAPKREQGAAAPWDNTECSAGLCCTKPGLKPLLPPVYPAHTWRLISEGTLVGTGTSLAKPRGHGAKTVPLVLPTARSKGEEKPRFAWHSVTSPRCPLHEHHGDTRVTLGTPPRRPSVAAPAAKLAREQQSDF